MKTFLICLFLSIYCSVAQNSAIQFTNADYPFGSKPTNVQSNDLEQAYLDWKNRFADASCSDGRARVKFDDPNFSVSEGIAYGMLLSAYANDKELFDGLWKYYKSHRNPNGVMHWKINGCDTVDGQNGATDAELDAAIALIIAGNRFDNSGTINYHEDAKELIAVMKQHEVEANTYVLKPGDAWGGSNNTNPSYFAPGYYKVYGEFTNDQQFWNNVIVKTYEVLNANLSTNNAVGGLVSDWCKADGTYSDIVPWAHNAGKSYYYDAARTPWRIATDYLWFGENNAKDYLSKCQNFVTGVGGINKITAGYNQDGTQIPGNSGTPYKDVVFTGAFSSALMISTNQNMVDEAYTALKSQTSNAYFANTLRVLYMYTMSGNLYNPNANTAVLNTEEFNNQKINSIAYPNPSSEKLHLTNFDLGSIIKIYDSVGKEVMSISVKNANIDVLNISTLSPGVYFIKSKKKTIRFIRK